MESCDTEEFDDPYSKPPISELVFEKIKRLLHLLYHEESVPKLVRRRILEASVRAQEEWHATAIKRAYESKDPDWQLTAVFCMRYVHGFEKEILAALKNGDVKVQAEAVQAAGDHELDEAWDHVYSLLKKEGKTPKPLMLAAINSIAKIRRDPPSFDILNHLVDSNDEEIAEAADEATSEATDYIPFDEDDFDEDAGDASGWIN